MTVSPDSIFTPDSSTSLFGGTADTYKFANGYGASVVSHDYSYGGDEGLFEVGVLDRNGRLTYDTPITDDVIGWLTRGGVHELLEKIAALPECACDDIPTEEQP